MTTNSQTKKIYILDRYTNKNLWMEAPSDENFELWEKLIFEQLWWDGKKSMSIGTYIWEKYNDIERDCTYVGRLTADELQEFEDMQKKAKAHFPMFKKMFKTAFPTAIPVTARYHMFVNQWYFYFYAEQRFNFVEFIKEFRQALWGQFFLFQVGARDMVKMSPGTDHIIGCNWLNLCCKSNRPLPSIDVEDLLVQHLDGRDIERLKWRCGKLKCSLVYEVETYVTESKKFPEKGSTIDIHDCEKCGMVTNYNIMTGKIDVQLDDGIRVQIDLAEIKKIHENRKKKVPNDHEREMVAAAKDAVG
jgi:cell fate regulator YaaT (PSP1 superfamily)